jgi:hypothetical protein
MIEWSRSQTAVISRVPRFDLAWSPSFNCSSVISTKFTPANLHARQKSFVADAMVIKIDRVGRQ